MKALRKIAEAIRSTITAEPADSIALDIFKVGDDISVWAFIAATDIDGEHVWVDINISNEANGYKSKQTNAVILSGLNYKKFCQLNKSEQSKLLVPFAAKIYKKAKVRLDEAILLADSTNRQDYIIKECL